MYLYVAHTIKNPIYLLNWGIGDYYKEVVEIYLAYPNLLKKIGDVLGVIFNFSF